MTTRSTMMMTVAGAGLALMMPAAASASSFDYNGRDVRTEVVSVADLDLSTGWGMDRLIKRLRSRIDTMCDWDEECRDEAWLSADWQVARNLDRAQWRRRLAMERANDRQVYRFQLRRTGPGAPPPQRLSFAPPQPQPVGQPVGVKTTTTTQTFTVKTTTVTLIYRVPPVDYRGWQPRCGCDR